MTVADPEPETATSDEAALLDYLRGRDVGCPLCNYNLRGLTSCRCPECGHELRLGVGLVEPRIGAWVTCLVGVTAAGGMGVLTAINLVVRGWGRFSAGSRPLDFMALAWFLASVALVPILIVSRRRYRRLSPPNQWALAAGAIALTALAFGIVVT
jgi:hypothetical protein